MQEARRTLLHLRDELLVEQSPRLLVQRAVDRHDIALAQHLFQTVYSTTANLLLDLGLQRLVIEVEKLLAVEWLQSSEHTLANTSDRDRPDDLALEIVLVLGYSCDIPFASLDLLVSGDEVADEC